MVEESRDVFTKRLLGEKHINGIMCEIQGDHASPPCPLLPTPMAV